MTVDLTTDLGRRVAEQLTGSGIIWLTTLKPDGTPEPNPVWFFWDGSNILIRSQNNPKVRNIAADPRVVLNSTPTRAAIWSQSSTAQGEWLMTMRSRRSATPTARSTPRG